VAAWIWLAGAAVYVICEAIAAARFPGYSYINDYISDLGVSAVMNYGAFMLHGSLFLSGAVVITFACPKLGWARWGFLAAAVANAIGNILVGTFRSGASAHVIGAGLAIVGGNVAVIVAGLAGDRVGASRSYRAASVFTGVVGLVSLLALIIDGTNGIRFFPVGIVERGAVYSIIVWEIITGVTILLRRTSRP
jgi:hypothetical membrane protein